MQLFYGYWPGWHYFLYLHRLSSPIIGPGRTQESRAIKGRLGQRTDIVSKYTSYRQEVSVVRLSRYYNAIIIPYVAVSYSCYLHFHLSAGIKPPNERSAARRFNPWYRRVRPNIYWNKFFISYSNVLLLILYSCCYNFIVGAC